MEVFNTQEYQQFEQYFEALDSFSLSEAVIYIPQIAYLLIGEFPVLAKNLDTNLEDILPGRNYRMDYIEGFREGVKHFNDKWTLTPDTLYGAKSDHYFADLRAAYEGSGDQNTADGLLERWANPGWLFESENIPIMINSESMRETGYYAGLVFKYRELEKRHDRLRSKQEPEARKEKECKSIVRARAFCVALIQLSGKRNFYRGASLRKTEIIDFVKSTWPGQSGKTVYDELLCILGNPQKINNTYMEDNLIDYEYGERLFNTLE